MICVVRKSDGFVVDVNQKYDARYFDHVEVIDGAIPDGGDCRLYYRDNAGAIVLRPVPVDPKRAAIASATTLAELKAALLL